MEYGLDECLGRSLENGEQTYSKASFLTLAYNLLVFSLKMERPLSFRRMNYDVCLKVAGLIMLATEYGGLSISIQTVRQWMGEMSQCRSCDQISHPCVIFTLPNEKEFYSWNIDDGKKMGKLLKNGTRLARMAEVVRHWPGRSVAW